MNTSDPTRRRRPFILGIETSCDDTACAVVDGAGRVLASVVSRQLAAHRPYGGVVPEIASREHLRNWPPVSVEALRRAGLALGDVDAVAATRGPGLVGALLVGLSLGKALAWGLELPFFAVHHLEGHLYSPFLVPAGDDGADAPPPADPLPESFAGLVVSGGHSNLYAVEGSRVETLGETRDDAMGEVFDKVGKRLGLPYPQGPHVDRLAEAAQGGSGDDGTKPGRFGVAELDGFAFSFSGLKSQALNAIEALERQGVETDLGGIDLKSGEGTPPEVGALLAEFRAAAVEQVVGRVRKLHGERSFATLAVSGGAAANRRLRRELARWAERQGVDLRLVPFEYSGDNAAMIAHAALVRLHRGEADDPFTAEAESRLALA